MRHLDIPENITTWKWASVVLLTGGLIFWIGAFTPPYRQWMTNDTGEYLTIIAGNRLSWYFIHTAFIAGIVITTFGLHVFSHALYSTKYFVWPKVAAQAFSFGALLATLNFTFRLTVAVWAAKQFVVQQQLPESFQTWMDWTNLLFGVYMVLAYFSCGCIGFALLKLSLFPAWLSWFCLIYGASGVVLYLTGFIFFEPPLMVHLPYIVLSIAILLRLKSAT